MSAKWARWAAAEQKIAELFKNKQRPVYSGELPASNDGLGLGLLGVTGDQLLDPLTYERIKADYLAFAAKLGIADVRFIPISALAGDMIVDRGERLSWYDGPTLLEILEDRYGRRSTLVTSQLPIASWFNLIGDPTYADAILDRLVHNAHRLELSGESMRRNLHAQAA